ncbi:PPC domain-containing DNA-binding protein [Psychrobacillus sp. FJAT-21963]|uniref:PPC domain-containing DNA-binding protein n=1 Tax=Psychrobacillus sp. FJAT-21963 TaxID=1712028 RepID=UPI0006FA44DB|nr:PPC domain-containing DNA-binding protein [Psychrobacillus sp. FJAT-21963]KQL35769.1 DNA-binding protein [Psychrobacillus sp. FJAT-21963]
MSLIRANYATGQLGKTVGARLVYGTDLLEGIEQLCKVNCIEYATIISCFGSFQRSGFVYLVPNKNSKIGVGYNDLIVKEGPIEFLQGTGVVCKREGEYETHFHGSMCDQHGNIFGGHFIKGENPVITVDVVLAEVTGMEFHRKFDEETGANQFYPVDSNKTSTNKL